MRIGQMSIKKLSDKADYLQLDICGLEREEVLERYKGYGRDIPVVIHGDWSKKGNSENNLIERQEEYIKIINSLKKETTILGFTLHPPFKKKISKELLFQAKNHIESKTGIEIFIENRCQKKIHISTPEEIIEFSEKNLMTVDIPQLYISCGYNYGYFIEVLSKINHKNVKEYHVANIKRLNGKTLVARNILDEMGEINFKDIFSILNKDALFTLEILGSINTFEKNFEVLNNL